MSKMQAKTDHFWSFVQFFEVKWSVRVTSKDGCAPNRLSKHLNKLNMLLPKKF